MSVYTMLFLSKQLEARDMGFLAFYSHTHPIRYSSFRIKTPLLSDINEQSGFAPSLPYLFDTSQLLAQYVNIDIFLV